MNDHQSYLKAAAYSAPTTFVLLKNYSMKILDFEIDSSYVGRLCVQCDQIRFKAWGNNL